MTVWDTINSLRFGDLIEVERLDASESTGRLEHVHAKFDTPVRSVGYFLGIKSKRTRNYYEPFLVTRDALSYSNRYGRAHKTASPHDVHFAAFTVSLNIYEGFQSKDGSSFYYSIDAHGAIPALLKAYDLTGTVAYLDAVKLAGGTFLYNMQHKPNSTPYLPHI